MSTDVTLSGGRDAVWIFQIAGTLTQANVTKVILKSGARPKNVFWQASGAVAIWNDGELRGSNPGQKTDRREDGRIGKRQTVSTDCGHSAKECGYTARSVRTKEDHWVEQTITTTGGLYVTQ